MVEASEQGLGSRLIERWQRGLAATEVLGGGILIFMMASTTIDTVFRYLVSSSIVGLSELNGHLLIALVFLSLGSTQVVRGHIRAELLVNRLPPRVQAAFDAVAWASALVFFALMAHQSWLQFMRAYSIGEYMPGVGWPIWWSRGMIPLGCALICVQLALDLGLSIGRVFGWVAPERRARQDI